MVELEFYIYEDELWCKTKEGKNFVVEETNSDVVAYILNNVRARYSEAYKALEKCYAKSAINPLYFQFLMARRFCKCNFACLDPTSFDVEDVKFDGMFNFEKVACPMRGECPHEGIICMPQLDNKLSNAETRVMKLLYEGKNKDEIADILFISPGTVKNHIKSSYLKLGIHSEAEFIRYANSHNIFH